MARAELAYSVQLSLGKVNRTDARRRRPMFIEVKCRYFSMSMSTGGRLLPSQWNVARHRAICIYPPRAFEACGGNSK